jgi:hypothetical protein
MAQFSLGTASKATPDALAILKDWVIGSIPTAPTKVHDSQRLIEAFGTNKALGTN